MPGMVLRALEAVRERGREGHYALSKLTGVDPRDEAMAMLGSRGMMSAHLQGRQ